MVSRKDSPLNTGEALLRLLLVRPTARPTPRSADELDTAHARRST